MMDEFLAANRQELVFVASLAHASSHRFRLRRTALPQEDGKNDHRGNGEEFKETVCFVGYLETPQLWFESLQNWQSVVDELPEISGASALEPSARVLPLRR